MNKQLLASPAVQSLTKYTSKAPDDQGKIHWTQEENLTWQKLILRQNELVKSRASNEFLEGLKLIDFSLDQVPQHQAINRRLEDFSGWKVEPVPALIPAQEFFTMLAHKQFPAASFIRIPEELDYIQEPDIFHEFYGHVPLLTNLKYASFMEEFGKFALSLAPNLRRKLFRIFWFSIEFGLIQTNQGLKAYGGGILSSIKETVYCLEDPMVKREPFDTLTVLRTPYRIDIPQPLYYILKSYDDLYDVLNQDLIKLLEVAQKMGDLPALYSELKEEL